MNLPAPGEVWLADLGIAAKVRPVLVVSVPYLRRLGRVHPNQMAEVEEVLRHWLGLAVMYRHAFPTELTRSTHF